HSRTSLQQPEILFHDRDLHIGVEWGAEVQEIAPDCGRVVFMRVRQEPVELLERIVQVGNEEEAHSGNGPRLGFMRENNEQKESAPSPAQKLRRSFQSRAEMLCLDSARR